jgi:hypothetical protein
MAKQRTYFPMLLAGLLAAGGAYAQSNSTYGSAGGPPPTGEANIQTNGVPQGATSTSPMSEAPTLSHDSTPQGTQSTGAAGTPQTPADTATAQSMGDTGTTHSMGATRTPQSTGAAATTTSQLNKPGEASSYVQGQPNANPDMPRAKTRAEVRAELLGRRAAFQAERQAMLHSGSRSSS